MAAPVGSLVVRVGSDTRGFTSGIKGSARDLRRFDRQASKTGRRFSKSFDGMNKSVGGVFQAVTSLKGLLTAFVGVQFVQGVANIIGRMSAFALATAQTADEIEKLSQRSGVAAATLSELKLATELGGSSVKALGTGIRTAQKNLEDFRSFGKGEAADAIRLLGREFRLAVESGKSFEELLPIFSDSLRNLATQEQRVLVAQKLLGRSGVELLPVFQKGSAALEGFREEAKKAGATIDADLADKGARLNDEFTRLTATWEGLKLQALDTFGETTIAAVKTATAALRVFRKEGLNSLFGPVIGETLRDAFKLPEQLALRRRFASQGIGPPRPPPPEMRLILDVPGPEIPEQIAEGTLKQLNEGLEFTKKSFVALYSEAERFAELAETGLGFEAIQEHLLTEDTSRKDLLRQRLEDLRTSLMTEREIEMEAFQQKMADLREGLEQELILEEDFRKQREELEQQHADRIKDIKKRERRDDLEGLELSNRRKFQMTVGFLSSMTGQLAAASSDQFELQKTLSIASATLSAIESVISSYKWGSDIGGPPVGAIMAAIAAGVQFARVAQISSQTLKSRGSGSAAGGGGSVPSSVTQPEPIPVSTVNISLQGDRFSREDVRTLIHEINEATSDGARINVR